jgi:hypothetical protein
MGLHAMDPPRSRTASKRQYGCGFVDNHSRPFGEFPGTCQRPGHGYGPADVPCRRHGQHRPRRVAEVPPLGALMPLLAQMFPCSSDEACGAHTTGRGASAGVGIR